MENINRTLTILQKARYLQAIPETSNISNLELLSLGKRLRTIIETHWQQSQATKVTQVEEPHIKKVCADEVDIKKIDPRLQFVYTKIFRESVKNLQPCNNKMSVFSPVKMKLIESSIEFSKTESLKFKHDASKLSTRLVTDHFFHESCGLAKFYKIQRERKIWWMRFSSDPSRYYLEPYKFSSNSEMPNAQSITVKSRLCFGDLSVENITLVPLTNVELEHKEDFEIFNERIKKKQPPTVIRSVIDLDVAACALIFDAAANKRRDETLFFNRKLAPYQCQILTESNGSNLAEMKALSAHISNVMSRAGLRIFKEDDKNMENQFDLEIQRADHLGIPYTVLVNNDSLKTGLLKLRSRDTTLMETIHISDIPNYLLSIFCAS